MMHTRTREKEVDTAKRPRLSRDRLAAYALLWPSLLGVALFFVVPFGVILYYSVTDSVFSGNFVFWDNFAALIQNKAFGIAVVNTLEFTGMAVPLAVGLSLLLALALEARIPGKSKFRTVFLSPIMVPVASIVLVWQILFHQNGSVNQLLGWLGLQGVDWLRSGWDKVVIVLLFLWKNLGYNMVLFMAALSNIPSEVVEAAYIDGAGKWRAFWYVRLRYLLPTVLFVIILSLANSFKVFREIYLLSGSYPGNSLYMLQHFMNNMFRSLNLQMLCAAAVLMAVVLGVVLAILLVLERRLGKDVEE